MENQLKHISIIPDGNRRWAKERGLPTLEGHRKGAENFEGLINKTKELGIQYFSSWAFSTENWKRSEEERSYIFGLARDFIKRYRQKFLKEKTRFIHIGRLDRLPEDIRQAIMDFVDETKAFTDFTVILGVDYGGHDEIVRAVNKVIAQGENVTEQTISNHLDTAGIPDPDLIIRTSKEQRLSGFMPWQSVYSEYYFPEVYFPDFGPSELKAAIEEFYKRNRRFGGN